MEGGFFHRMLFCREYFNPKETILQSALQFQWAIVVNLHGIFRLYADYVDYRVSENNVMSSLNLSKFCLITK
jgi:hypothetical protein